MRDRNRNNASTIVILWMVRTFHGGSIFVYAEGHHRYRWPEENRGVDIVSARFSFTIEERFRLSNDTKRRTYQIR